MNKCFAVISLISKSKTAGIYAQSLTEIKDLIKHNSTEKDFSKTVLGLFIFLKLSRPVNSCFKIPGRFQVFHDRMKPECDGRVRLSKSEKNIEVGGWIIYMKLLIRVTIYLIRASLIHTDQKKQKKNTAPLLPCETKGSSPVPPTPCWTFTVALLNTFLQTASRCGMATALFYFQRVVKTAQYITGVGLPFIKDVYLQMLPKESEKYHQILVSPQSQTVHSTPIEETLKESSLSHQQTQGQFLSLSCQPTELQSQALNYILY